MSKSYASVKHTILLRERNPRAIRERGDPAAQNLTRNVSSLYSWNRVDL